jgi:hypothetical protein
VGIIYTWMRMVTVSFELVSTSGFEIDLHLG